jgi:hypothetical protein
MSPCTDPVDQFSGSGGRPQARATLGAPRMMEIIVVIKEKSRFCEIFFQQTISPPNCACLNRLGNDLLTLIGAKCTMVLTP